MKKLFFLASFIYILSDSSAQNIYINFINGTNEQYSLASIRTITFSGGNIQLNKRDGSMYSWPLNSIRQYNYTGKTSTGIFEQNTEEENDILIFPNPSKEAFEINYPVSQNGLTTVEILTLNGLLVKKLSAYTSSDKGVVKWDGKNNEGQQSPDGVYICRISSSNQVITKKIILSK